MSTSNSVGFHEFWPPADATHKLPLPPLFMLILKNIIRAFARFAAPLPMPKRTNIDRLVVSTPVVVLTE